MALSDWDTLAVGDTGNSDGTFTTPLGVTIEIYKNWAYVQHAPSWRTGGAFSEPTVMQIIEGQLTYLDLRVTASRGPQNGIYLVASCGSKYAYEGSTPFRVMIGCGVSGYTQPNEAPRTETLLTMEDGHWVDQNGHVWTPPEWVGVHRESMTFLRSFAAGVLEDHPLLTDDVWDNAERFNQGDAILSDALDLPTLTSTPGESEEPIVATLFKRREDESKGQ